MLSAVHDAAGGSGAAVSRRMWQLLEPVHFAAYRAPEVTERYQAAGLKGFWMGYFASRSYPLGPVPPDVVVATFFSFHPSLVHRALPGAWHFSTVEEVARARSEGVDAALRRALGGRVDGAEVAEAADLAAEAAAACGIAGRPLFAAHAALPWPDPPHLRLWHAATLLREHRGDGHVAACLAAGLDGLAAHVTQVAAGLVPREAGQRARGWSDEDWAAAEARLAARGWLADGRLTDEGRAAREAVERVTDDLAAEPWDHLGEARTERLADLLQPVALAVLEAGLLLDPNPIGIRWPAAGG